MNVYIIEYLSYNDLLIREFVADKHFAEQAQY